MGAIIDASPSPARKSCDEDRAPRRRYFAFGDTDAYVLADLPDNVSAAACATAVNAGGGATIRTVVLLTAAEVDAAVSKTSTYRPPGS